MKKSAKSANLKREKIDHSQFTRNTKVYIGFSDSESDENVTEEIEVIRGRQNGVKKITETSNISNKPKILSTANNIASSKIDKPEKNFIGRKRDIGNVLKEIPEKEKNITGRIIKKNEKMEKVEKISVDKKIQLIEQTQIRNKLTEKDIFNPDFDNDIIIPKKQEFRDRIESDFLNKPGLNQITEKIKNRSIYFKSNFERLLKLYKFVEENGGFEEVIGNLLLDEFMKKSDYTTYDEARRDLNDFLFHFLLYSNLKNKQSTEDLEEICKKNPSMLKEVPIIYANDSDSEAQIDEKIRKALDLDLVILRGFLRVIKLDNSLFTKENLRQNCSVDNKIDVMEQAVHFQGFTRNTHFRRSWPLGKYLHYVNDKEKEILKEEAYLRNVNHQKSSMKKSQLVNYGVNIELDKYPELYKELEMKVPALLNFGSVHDSLAHVRQHIPGMTIPQMYIKVKDVWTGGHEENLRMRSINISHGPGDSKWWATPVDESQKLVDTVETLYKMNIYKKEGIWFPEKDFFYQNDIHQFYTVQKPGDIALVGSGTIHWVKAASHAINTSWNFGHKDSRSLRLSMNRYEINKRIRFRSLVPMKTLIMDILNCEMFELDVEYVKTCYEYLAETIRDSIKEFNELKQDFEKSPKKYDISYLKEPLNYTVDACEECLQEVFNSWGFCEPCSTNQSQKILCVACFQNHLKVCYRPQQQFVFYRYEEEDLRKFMNRLEIKIKYDTELTSCHEELKGVQEGLLRRTKDSLKITAKKFSKLEISEDLVQMQMHPSLFREYDPNEISSLLIPCMDTEKLTSEEFKFPLQADKELIQDPYMPFDDIVEDINLKRFSPIRESERKNSDDVLNNNNNNIIMDIDFGDNVSNYRLNKESDDGYKYYGITSTISKNQPGISYQNNPNHVIGLTYNTSKPVTTSVYNQKLTSKVNKPTTFNFHTGIRGRSLISLVNNDDKSVHSHRSGSRDEQSESRRVNNNVNPMLSLVKDIPNVQELKFNLKEKEKEGDRMSSSQNTENIIDIFNNFSQNLIRKEDSAAEDTKEINCDSGALYNPYVYNMNRKNINKSTHVTQLKKAKILLAPLADRDKAKDFKFISQGQHRNIFEGKKIILENLDNQEALVETNLKTFIEKIVKNDNLITDYREMFEEEIYAKLN